MSAPEGRSRRLSCRWSARGIGSARKGNFWRVTEARTAPEQGEKGLYQGETRRFRASAFGRSRRANSAALPSLGRFGCKPRRSASSSTHSCSRSSNSRARPPRVLTRADRSSLRPFSRPRALAARPSYGRARARPPSPRGAPREKGGARRPRCVNAVERVRGKGSRADCEIWPRWMSRPAAATVRPPPRRTAAQSE